jgi:hypothetical protein
MPAVASAIFSAIFAYFATKNAYGDSLYTIFPAMEEKNMTLLNLNGTSGEHHEDEYVIGVSFNCFSFEST